MEIIEDIRDGVKVFTFVPTLKLLARLSATGIFAWLLCYSIGTLSSFSVREASALVAK